MHAQPEQRGTSVSADGIVRSGDVLELPIDSLAFGGEGVARVQSGERPLVVFVEDVVPGDVALVKIGKKKKSYATGYVEKIVSRSPERIEPRCKHFGPAAIGCGGCTWQFMDADTQRKIKEQQVRDAMTRIGGFSDDVVLPIIGGDAWHYRNKMEFSFGRDAAGKLGLGLHLKRRHYDVVELTECYLIEPFAGGLVSFVREFFRKFESEKGFDPELVLKTFTVRVGKNTGEIMMILCAENGTENFMKAFQDELVPYCSHKKIPLTSLYFLHRNNVKGKPNTMVEKLCHGSPVIRESLQLPNGHVLHFDISPQAFFQPNTQMAEVLYAKTLEAAQLTGKETVFDLYCGTGTIGLFCSAKAAKVYGVELNESAVKNAKANAMLNGIKNAEFVVGDVQEILENFKKNLSAAGQPDVVLVDPPRNGLAPKVVDSVAEFGPKRIVYVSCNPTSLARDASLFAKLGYTLKYVQPVDQFPQTYHIENVALLVKED